MDLVARVKGILLNPKGEWATIDTEPATVGGLYSGYIIPLAAIPAVCAFIGMSVIGYGSILGVSVKIGMSRGLTYAVVQYAAALIGVYVMALVIDGLAPSFGGQKSQMQALKVAAYSATASWLAGVFLLIPALRLLGILGLYSLYLLFLGIPVLMKSPPEKSMGYTVVVIIATIVLYLIVGGVVGAVTGVGGMAFGQ